MVAKLILAASAIAVSLILAFALGWSLGRDKDRRRLQHLEREITNHKLGLDDLALLLRAVVRHGPRVLDDYGRGQIVRIEEAKGLSPSLPPDEY